MGIDARVALAAMVLLLTGCSTVVAPEPGLTADELDALRQYRAEGLWAATGLYPDQRPANPPVTTVSAEELPYAYVKCMNIAGFDDYAVQDDGYSVTGNDGESSELERLTNYLCAMSFDVEGEFESMPNASQIGYLYDYYAQTLVPCLAAHGYPPDRVPTRTEFEAQGATWHPYFAMHADEWLELFADRSMLIECPPAPPGMEDPGFAAYFTE